ncbi:MAG: class I SAM-dependent methyltransferase [Syntrophobacter sp.]
MADQLATKQIEECNRLQKEYFNENVDLFEPPLPRGVPERLEATIEASRLQRGERVLDVGTGTGILIPYILKHHPYEIHVCDLAENMLLRVKRKFPRVVPHLCDVGDLQLPDGSIDLVFINACFSNIMDKAKCLDNLYRMLRHKGRLVVSHPLGKEFIIELKKYAPFHLDLLPDEPEARQLCERHGFRIVSFVDEPLFYIFVAETTMQTDRAGITTATRFDPFRE